MLPACVSAFTFQPGASGADDAIAARTSACVGTGRVAVLGCSRPGILVSLARQGASVVGLDPSRRTLTAARAVMGEHCVEEQVTLFAADPRDLVVPGGVDAALVTSFGWRVIVPQAGREEMLACLRRAVEPVGRLLIDVDRLPPSGTRETERSPLWTDSDCRWSWRHDPTRELVTLYCENDGFDEVAVDLSDITPEATVSEVEAAGFRVVSAVDPTTGNPVTAASERVWIVAEPDITAA